MQYAYCPTCVLPYMSHTPASLVSRPLETPLCLGDTILYLNLDRITSVLDPSDSTAHLVIAIWMCSSRTWWSGPVYKRIYITVPISKPILCHPCGYSVRDPVFVQTTCVAWALPMYRTVPWYTIRYVEGREVARIHTIISLSRVHNSKHPMNSP